MDINITLISGDKLESTVYVICFSDEFSLLFKFCRDTSRPKSLSSRIVACFHDVDVEDEVDASLSSRADMRQVIKSLIHQVWTPSISHPSIGLPDVVVEVQDTIHGGTTWRICHEGSYREYLKRLIPTADFLSSHIASGGADSSKEMTVGVQHVALEKIQFFHMLSGRGGSRKVRVKSRPEWYVYKGLSFRLFLELDAEEFEAERANLYREIGLVLSLPRHPNIVPPPKYLVSATTDMAELATEMPSPSPSSKGQTQPRVICGSLYPYLEKQSLQEVVDQSNENHAIISAASKAKWAHQICSALELVHKSRNFHMDLKPSNILLDDGANAILIDWERCGASPFFIAPEADGSWDVSEEETETSKSPSTSDQNPRKPDTASKRVEPSSSQPPPRRLRYTRHALTPPAVNIAHSWPKRNVFSLWQRQCPRALRAAEVYALGRTLWAIFEEISSDVIDEGAERGDGGHVDEIGQTEDRPRGKLEMRWKGEGEVGAVPARWRAFVESCVRDDPNERVDLFDWEAVVGFWEGERRMVEEKRELEG